MSPLTYLILVSATLFGIFSAIAPLGPVTVLVIQRGLGGDPWGALRLGLGRVPPETLYCGFATFGMVALLDQFPGAKFTIKILSILAFLVVGAWLFVQKPRRIDVSAEPEGASRRGEWAGFIISALNPTLILSWASIVAFMVAVMGVELNPTQRVVLPLAQGFGVGLGYWILVMAMRRWGEMLEDEVVQWAIRSMGVLFFGIGLWQGGVLLVSS